MSILGWIVLVCGILSGNMWMVVDGLIFIFVLD